MIFDLLITAFLFGLVVLLGVLGVLRGLYRSNIFQPPDMPGDSAENLPFESIKSVSGRICVSDD